VLSACDTKAKRKRRAYRVQNGTDSATNGTRNDVIDNLALLGVGFGDQLPDLVNAAEVAGVPEDVTPHGRLKTLVQRQDTLIAHRLDDDINHAVVPAGRGLVLQTNLDQLEGNDDERLGSTSRGAGQDGKRLVHGLLAEQVLVKVAPFFIGSKLGRTLGRLHENRSSNTAVQAREAVQLSTPKRDFRYPSSVPA